MLAQPVFSEALLDVAKQNGLDVALDTSGFGDGDLLQRLARKADHILYDLKAMQDEAHQAYTGVSNRLILSNLRQLAAAGLQRKVIIRLPLISGVNDGDGNISAVGQLMREFSLTAATLLPYHGLGLSKSRGIGREQEIFAPPSSERLEQIAQLLHGYGVTVRVRE
ncbi:pyruvate formate lyase activating enzyme [Desulfotomaculum arcticum]|uniref:Pyruvate formate lyase activating enzyme n=1 Tax=Desulfotruncus arcticus DSM 17038 TaxID=1121424 RepID=A0A1I2TE75_9FIRM|nr:pyruvate formate lyase activating enzyme [Desulfotomaculum arcticum] [Desulfotruncus arcticus DSM 17038]